MTERFTETLKNASEPTWSEAVGTGLSGSFTTAAFPTR